MIKTLNRIYVFLPVWLQNIGISLYGFLWSRRRFGGIFRQELHQSQMRERYSASEWQAYQTQQLRELLCHAVENVAYYRECFSGLDYKKFALQDLLKLPLLDKQTIRSNPELFLNHKIPRKGVESFFTSGTTGTPLVILVNSQMHQRLSAIYEARCRRWAGVNYKMSRAMIGGRLIVPKSKMKPPFWRYNWAEKQIYFSPFHISPDTAAYYVTAMNRFKPDYFVGFAHSYYVLSEIILKQQLKIHQAKAILTSSETLTPIMRATIEKAFQCPVFDGYSGVEACCLASECEHHRFHISPDVGVVEIIGENGNPVEAGTMGEVVATGLLNFVQPLIRYRTGDYAVISKEKCPCGRQMPFFEKIVGRIEDALITRDGRELVRFDHLFKGIAYLREGQVIQEELDHVRLRLVTEPGFGEAEKKLISKRFEQQLNGVRLSFELVDHIERTAGGKFQAVISKVKT